MTNITEKENIFNIFFARQCSLLETNSVLPAPFSITQNRLDSVNLDPVKILAYIRSLSVNKSHGWDEVSVRMVKICGEALVKPLTSIFQFSLDTGRFPSKWKRGNVVPIHKKGDKDAFSQYLVHFLKGVSMIHSTFTLKKTHCFLRANLAFVKVIPVCLSCCP